MPSPSNIRIDGASDHLVSEALYLTDPEGNGIEIYSDRAAQRPGRWNGSQIAMATERLNIPGVRRLRSGGRRRLAGRTGKQRRRPRASAGRRPGGSREMVAQEFGFDTRGQIRRAAPCSCRPAAITTISARIPGRAPAPASATVTIRALLGRDAFGKCRRKLPSAKIPGARRSGPSPDSRPERSGAKRKSPLNAGFFNREGRAQLPSMINAGVSAATSALAEARK